MKLFLIVISLFAVSASAVHSFEHANFELLTTEDLEKLAAEKAAQKNATSGSTAQHAIPEQYQLVKIGDLAPTFYWVAVEKESNQPKNRALLDMDGKALAYVTEKFYREILMEGTGKLLDGRIINFAGRIQKPDGTKEVRYLICPEDAPYGYGINGIKLRPFRSVAVDPSVVPIGSLVYIPKAAGTLLPDGTTHDGFFEASDIGDRIISQRIDMFTAYGDQSSVFTKHGLENMKKIEVYLVK